MPGAEISALPMGICALVVGVLKARISFLSLRSELPHHMAGPKLNRWFCSVLKHPKVYILLRSKIQSKKTHNIYIHIYIYIYIYTYIHIYIYTYLPAHSEIFSCACLGSGLC